MRTFLLADAAKISEHLSVDKAVRWFQGLFEQKGTLIRNPTRWPRAAESDRFREWIIREYANPWRKH
jgi:hypothetical protein